MEIKLKSSDFINKINKSELIKNFFDINLGSVFTDILDVKHSKEMKAFMLLFKTAKKTNVNIARKINQEIIDKSSITDFSSFENKIRNFLEQEITITEEFFTNTLYYNPEYIHSSYSLFEEFLISLKIQIPKDLNYLYYQTYRLNLQSEFQKQKDYYIELLNYFDNPISVQNELFDKQIEYYKYIASYYTIPLQADIEENKETLRDLYIEPFFDIHEHNVKFEKIANENGFIKPKNKTISIHSFLINYFINGNKFPDCKENYNMLFILGQPGQGKTSMCYKFIYDYLEFSKGLPKIPLYFIKIRDLIAKDFIERPFEEINKKLNSNIRFQEEECILLLDGLDEAYMSGGLKDEDLSNLYDRLNKTSNGNKKLKIILTSRFNYLKIENPCVDGSLVIQIRELNDIQIKDYSLKFKHFYPDNKFVERIDEILKNKKYEPVKELLRQAVLIYFIAISDIDIDKKDSRSNIYNKLFETLTRRSWDKSGQLSYIKTDVKNNSFKYEKYLREFIRNIAFEIYQSPFLYITLDKIKKLDSTKIFIKKCFEIEHDSTDKIKDLSKYLLISFYFQESNKKNDNDTAIEFFHNSLWEYLVAEYIWEEYKKLILQKDDDGDLIELSKEQCFDFLNNIIGQKKLTEEINSNLIKIIENEIFETKEIIFNQTRKIFSELLKSDFLLEYSFNNNSLTSREKTIELFKLYWTIYYESNDFNNNYIIINYHLNEYLLDQNSEFWLFTNFYSLIFNEVNLDLCDNNEFNNVILKGCFSIFDFNHCKFNHLLIIFCSFNNTLLEGNNFNNVTFNKCHFGISNINNNEFKKCKFEHCEVPDINWLQNLSTKNKVDEWILENHVIKEVSEKNSFNSKIETKFYLEYIGVKKKDKRKEKLKEFVASQYEDENLKKYHLDSLGL